MNNAATSDQIGPLGPKDSQISTADLVKAVRNAKPAQVAVRDRNGTVIKMAPDIPLSDKVEDLKTEKLFPVRMVKHYRPFTENFEIGEQDEDTLEVTYFKPQVVEMGQDAGFIHQLAPDEFAKLPISEAREVIRRGIAIRTDEIA